MCRNRGAFTLVELLVVISIIALLLALLIPSLARARHVMRETRCLSQLRQIGQGQTAYGIDYRYYAPGYVTNLRSDLLQWPWYRGLRNYMGTDEGLWRCDITPPRFPQIAYMNEVVPGYTTLRWTDVSYGLPVYGSAISVWGARTFGGSVGLSFEADNYYTNSDRDMTPCRPDQVRWPERFALAGDMNNAGSGTFRYEEVRRVGFHGCDWPQCQQTGHGDIPPGMEQTRNDAATNQWVFADGHAEKLTYLDVYETGGRMFRRDAGWSAGMRGF